MTVTSSVVRVVITGAESTGKTTLARHLAIHFAGLWQPEYLRTFVEQKGALPEPSDVSLIARGYLNLESRYLKRAKSVLFYDTDLISNVLYSQYYFGQCPSWIEDKSYERSADLYLLTEPDIPWEPDPAQRESPEIRLKLHALFVAELNRRRLPFEVISGSGETRTHRAIQAVENLLTRIKSRRKTERRQRE